MDGHAWPYMAIHGHIWPCLAMSGHGWPYMAISTIITISTKHRQNRCRFIRSIRNSLPYLPLASISPETYQNGLFLASKCLGGNREAKSICYRMSVSRASGTPCCSVFGSFCVSLILQAKLLCFELPRRESGSETSYAALQLQASTCTPHPRK